MNKIDVNEKTFKLYISEVDILDRIIALGKQIKNDYEGKTPVFLGILNGSFMFVADLVRAVGLECEISFIKLSSYKGFTSTGNVVFNGQVDSNLRGRDVIVVEDIIDSGITLKAFLPALRDVKPASISVATLLFKPDNLKVKMNPEYVGFIIPDKFVIGYGLDYDGFGRYLKGVYAIDD